MEIHEDLFSSINPYGKDEDIINLDESPFKPVQFTVFKMSIVHFTVFFIALMVFSTLKPKNAHFTFYSHL